MPTSFWSMTQNCHLLFQMSVDFYLYGFSKSSIILRKDDSKTMDVPEWPYQCSYRGHGPQGVSDITGTNAKHTNGSHNTNPNDHNHRSFQHNTKGNHTCNNKNHNRLSCSQASTWIAQGQGYRSVVQMFSLLSSWLTVLLKLKEQDTQ